MKNLLKFIILLLRKIEKILTSRHWKIITGGVRASAPPSPKTRSEAILLFNFSTPCQAQLLGKMKIIHIWYFFTFCLLELFCNREGILFANHFHLLFIIFCIMLLIQKYYYLPTEIFCQQKSFADHNHLPTEIIWIIFTFADHNHLKIIIIWKSLLFANYSYLQIICIWIS